MARSSPSTCRANSRSCSEAPARAAGEQRRRRCVEQDEIGFLPRQEPADASRRCPSPARRPRWRDGARGRDRGWRRAQLADPIGLAERVQDGEAGARADIGADAELHARAGRQRPDRTGRSRGRGCWSGRRRCRRRPRPSAPARGRSYGRNGRRPSAARPDRSGHRRRDSRRRRDSARRRRRSRPDSRRDGCASARRDARRPGPPASASCSLLEVGTKRGVTA